MGEAITLVKNDAVIPLKEKEIVGFLSLGDSTGEHFYQALAEERILQRLTFTGDIPTVVNAAKTYPL